MILYTNGCSWTWGGGLDEHFRYDDGRVNDDIRLNLVWPKHLSDLLKTDKVYNISTACGSNQRIIRTTIDWVTSQSKTDLEDTVAVIQFSEWSRFEKYVPISDKDPYENLKERWLKCRIDSALFDYNGPEGPDEHRYLQEEIKHINRRLKTTSPIENFYTTLQQMYALKGIFDTYGVKDYYFWHLGQGWLSFPLQYRELIYKDFKVLDQFDNFTSWDDFNSSKGCSFKDHPDYWYYERLAPDVPVHPSLLGHKQLAELIYDRMKRKGFNR
jgi:hypothetical protein